MARTRKPKDTDAAEERERANRIDADEVREYFDALHEENDALKKVSAKHRGAMNKIYEKMADALDLPTRVTKHLYALDRAERDRVHKEKVKFERADRDTFRAIADAFGTDTPLGLFAKEAAERAGEERADPGE